jgi:hypothetical protein
MRPREGGDTPGITLRAHPPERSHRRIGATAYAGCSSCCCCCLHSAGSLAGAVVGTFYPRDSQGPAEDKAASRLADDEIDGPGVEAPAMTPVRSFYWAATLVASILVAWIAALKSDAWGALWVLAFALPLIQLGASLLAALLLAGSPAARGDGRAWRRLKRITVGSVLGFLVGVALLIMGYILCTAR